MQIINETKYNYKGFDFTIKELTDGFNTRYEVYDKENQPIVFKGQNNEGKEEKWTLSASIPGKIKIDIQFDNQNPEYFTKLMINRIRQISSG